MSNSTLEAIFARRSCRSFTGQKVEDETVANLAKAALAAPSGNNFQPVNVIVVQDTALLLELEKAVVDYFVKAGNEAVANRNKQRGNKVFYDASTVFFLAVKNNANTDTGIAAENIAIAAASLGLGNIILGLPQPVFNAPETAAFWKARLGFPEGYEYGLAVAVGYAADQGKPHEIDSGKISYIR
ncbi:nitroreductase family protein [Leadbettera azotonutricia]|uniref:Nitroreductase n=1 Tax=Leadbettera azotonutricia (strain ATCC BAA-888 / DSM 13862 / ZAS-9) TaxID=545695 RepID=F5YAA1_LEAAZ|nr:nitroreductase family protein [Leadbettera azotonutricia]AEF82786.1 nitroreductase [Leadbettera azotonutricia ZAS-9]